MEGVECAAEPVGVVTESIQTRFERFHAENPGVYCYLVVFARQLLAKGHRKASISLLVERVRWQVAMTTTDPDWKINNSFRSRYARKIMDENPDLAGFFETRSLIAA